MKCQSTVGISLNPCPYYVIHCNRYRYMIRQSKAIKTRSCHFNTSWLHVNKSYQRPREWSYVTTEGGNSWREVLSCASPNRYLPDEPRRQKNGLWGFRPGTKQTGLCSHRRWPEVWNFGFRKKRDSTIRIAKSKALISFAVTAKLICVFVFAHAKIRFSHVAAHIIVQNLPTMGIQAEQCLYSECFDASPTKRERWSIVKSPWVN